ncbi:MAG: hypothetical protein ACK5LY_00930 [Lachnospirales bacterium]
MNYKNKNNGFSYLEIVLSIVILIVLSFFAVKFYIGIDNLKYKSLAIDYGRQITTNSNEILHSYDNLDAALKNNYYYEYEKLSEGSNVIIQKGYEFEGNVLYHKISFVPEEINNYVGYNSITFNEVNAQKKESKSDIELVLYKVNNIILLNDIKITEVSTYVYMENQGEVYVNEVFE